ncbi:MFS transporter, partial [Pantoea sp. SIMBA_133]
MGGLLAAWIIGYGGVQTQAPKLTRLIKGDARALTAGWAAALAVLAILLALLPLAQVGWLVVGLLAFGVLFAINSSWHSYL